MYVKHTDDEDDDNSKVEADDDNVDDDNDADKSEVDADDDKVDDNGLPAYSHHEKMPPWWGNVSNDKGGNVSVSNSHHT